MVKKFEKEKSIPNVIKTTRNVKFLFCDFDLFKLFPNSKKQDKHVCSHV